VPLVEESFRDLSPAELRPGRLKIVAKVADARRHGGVHSHALGAVHVLLQGLSEKTVPGRLRVEGGLLVAANVIPAHMCKSLDNNPVNQAI